MNRKKAGGKRTIRIAIGISMLVLLLAGGVGAVPLIVDGTSVTKGGMRIMIMLQSKMEV